MSNENSETKYRLKMSEIKPGDKLVADNGFTCGINGKVLEVKQEKDYLYVDCDAGTHDLDGQECMDDPEYIVGFKRYNN